MEGEEYDFVDRPSEDFFCPVSLELLVEPQQTSCCGNHFSLQTAARLQADKKPCPVCKAKQWSSVLDKYHRRRVLEVRVRCRRRGSGCDWEGEVGRLREHDEECGRRVWVCEYCGTTCRLGDGDEKHWSVCQKFPVLCPNGCGVGCLQRRNLAQHRSVCPLEPVECQMKAYGCNVAVLRKDLASHMKDSELQHLMAMTLLNLTLTDELKKESEERDEKLSQLQRELQAVETALDLKLQRQHQLQLHMKKQYEVKTDQLNQILSAMKPKINEQRRMQTEMKDKLDQQSQIQTRMMTEVERIQSGLVRSLDSIKLQMRAGMEEQGKSLTQLKGEVFFHGNVQQQQQQPNGAAKPALPQANRLPATRDRSCTLSKTLTFGRYDHFKCVNQSQSSEPFFIHSYKFRLCISYFKEDKSGIGGHLFLMEGEYDDQLKWPVEIEVRLTLLNQGEGGEGEGSLASCAKLRWEKWERGSYRMVLGSNTVKYPELEKCCDGVQYMVNNCLRFRISVTVMD